MLSLFFSGKKIYYAIRHFSCFYQTIGVFFFFFFFLYFSAKAYIVGAQKHLGEYQQHIFFEEKYL